ncbi:hypothetical protein CB1_000688062 [Camelus ferus]|nr:hypothetical protein CB1_000688062 [Camelus ferus]
MLCEDANDGFRSVGSLAEAPLRALPTANGSAGRDKVAVLQALASTVHRDTTAAPYAFQDDPYLMPASSMESCLMPEYFEPQIEAISEAALQERIKLKKVKASVDMFDQLLQAESPARGSSRIIYDIMDQLAGKRFSPEDPDDDIKSTYEIQDARQTAPEWPVNCLNCIAVLLLRAGRTQEAWKMLGLFRKHNKIPRNELLNEFMDSATASRSPEQAMEVVKLAGAFSLPICEDLTQRVKAELTPSQEQKEVLGDQTALTSDSGSDGSSDSDSDSSEGK